MLALLLSCADAPDPGAPGSSGCRPLLVEAQCSVWECWTVHDQGVVGYTYGSGWRDDGWASLTPECTEPVDCCEWARAAAAEACPEADLGPSYCGAL